MIGFEERVSRLEEEVDCPEPFIQPADMRWVLSKLRLYHELSVDSQEWRREVAKAMGVPELCDPETAGRVAKHLRSKR